MDGLEDKLNAILSDPDAMGRIADMAKSIFGEKQDGEAKRDNADEESLLKRAAGMLRGNALRQDEAALITALRPFLSDERKRRLDRAVKIARLASLAKIAGELGILGGDDGV